jgi:hypothetical protein
MFKALQAIFYTCQIFISLQNVKSFTDYIRFNPPYVFACPESGTISNALCRGLLVFNDFR